jgi:hypothetical protein
MHINYVNMCCRNFPLYSWMAAILTFMFFLFFLFVLFFVYAIYLSKCTFSNNTDKISEQKKNEAVPFSDLHRTYLLAKLL